MTESPDNWRFANIERRLDHLERNDPAVLVERVSQIERQFDRRVLALEHKVDERLRQMDEETGALRRSIVAAAITLAISAILVAVTAWQVVG